jgi:hypothetical protein
LEVGSWTKPTAIEIIESLLQRPALPDKYACAWIYVLYLDLNIQYTEPTEAFIEALMAFFRVQVMPAATQGRLHRTFPIANANSKPNDNVVVELKVVIDSSNIWRS